jgi:hypothetical protein
LVLFIVGSRRDGQESRWASGRPCAGGAPKRAIQGGGKIEFAYPRYGVGRDASRINDLPHLFAAFPQDFQYFLLITGKFAVRERTSAYVGSSYKKISLIGGRFH